MISRKAWQRIQLGLTGTCFLCITMAITANAQVKKETTVEQQGLATQTVKVETGEVMYVAGNDLVVKTDEGELRHFPNVPDDKTVTVAGKELTVHDLKPGMKLQRTTITPTTPQMITTVKTVTGKVWHVNPPIQSFSPWKTARTNPLIFPRGRNSVSTARRPTLGVSKKE